MFCKKGVLGNFTKYTGRHLWQSLFFKSCSLRPATVLKKRLWHRCFTVNLVKFLRTIFIIEHIWWLLLQKHNMMPFFFQTLAELACLIFIILDIKWGFISANATTLRNGKNFHSIPEGFLKKCYSTDLLSFLFNTKCASSTYCFHVNWLKPLISFFTCFFVVMN